MRFVERLASLKWSVLVLAWLVLVLPLVPRALISPLVVLGIGGGLFLVNLLAFLWCSSFFRTRPGLLVFHAALGLFLILAGVGRLTWMEGNVEVAVGEWFEGVPMTMTQGPLHDGGIGQIRFLNEGFTITYDVGLKRGPTRNRVAWRDGQGGMVRGVIGDDYPLVLRHYRFYTTSNKGFAPILTWQPEGGQPVRAAFHLPSYPLFADQTNTWSFPNQGPTITATLVLKEPVLDESRPGQFRLPEQPTLKLAVRDGPEAQMQPGARLALPNGGVVFEGLTSWMGYRIHYDRTRSWLLATLLVGVAGLGWHYRTRFQARDWDQMERGG
ncbi:MAG: cytochrome c biogenesis protein ResB [Magnetococcales bacterium]|nr:cytochrome c biogenesis protein ResB [Magnetococcales bacterium]